MPPVYYIDFSVCSVFFLLGKVVTSKQIICQTGDQKTFLFQICSFPLSLSHLSKWHHQGLNYSCQNLGVILSAPFPQYSFLPNMP